MNETIKLLQNHKSIRKFNEEPVTEEEAELILGAATRGATAGNMMMYSIIKIRSRETLEMLAESCDNQPFIANASLALLFVIDNSKWHKYFEHRNIPVLFPDYKGPTIGDLFLGLEDTMISAQNAVIAAESLGIGTCYIGDIMEKYEFHKELFNLPKYTIPAVLLVLGHYDFEPGLRSRFKDPFVIFEEEYPDITSDFIEEMFSEEEKGSPDFAEKFYARKIDALFFKEMNRSLKLYLKDWL